MDDLYSPGDLVWRFTRSTETSNDCLVGCVFVKEVAPSVVVFTDGSRINATNPSVAFQGIVPMDGHWYTKDPSEGLEFILKCALLNRIQPLVRRISLKHAGLATLQEILRLLEASPLAASLVEFPAAAGLGRCKGL